MVEILVVTAIMVILLALITPAVTGMLKGSQLTQAAEILTGQLTLARQEALTRNQTVEVRLYQYSVGGAAKLYHSVQAFELLDSGTYVALGKAQALPGPIIIDSGGGTTALSTIVSQASGAAIPALKTGVSLALPVPGVGTNYNAVTFQFFRDGSTNLPLTAKWFLTLHNLNDGDAPTTVPKNFCSIIIDPYDGHIRTFRP